ncbi:hypothetical protein AB0A69_06735 [Streptomyces sp. NPDC045431]|uniref:hypothetical protein n=1 Tax=Streptomyces sp. NPDC045431 TaxID=3155613 RepID=UPI00340FE2A5
MGGAGGAGGAPLTSKIAAPAAFDSAQGWEVQAAWLPPGQPLPYAGPKLTEEQADETSGKLAVPQIALVPGRDREYFAVWARGQVRKDDFHKYKEAVSVAFYPADVAPVAWGTWRLRTAGSPGRRRSIPTT